MPPATSPKISSRRGLRSGWRSSLPMPSAWRSRYPSRGRFGTGKCPCENSCAYSQAFRPSPSAIIDRLELRRPIYRQTAAYGHFGRADLDLPWERLDVAERLKAALR